MHWEMACGKRQEKGFVCYIELRAGMNRVECGPRRGDARLMAFPHQTIRLPLTTTSLLAQAPSRPSFLEPAHRRRTFAEGSVRWQGDDDDST